MKFNRHVKQIVIKYFRKPLNPLADIKESYVGIWYDILNNLSEIRNVIYPIGELVLDLIVLVLILPVAIFSKLKLSFNRYRSSKKVKKYGMWSYIKKLIDKEIKL